MTNGELELRFHSECLTEASYIFIDDSPRRGAILPYRRSHNPHIAGLMPFRWQDSRVYSMAIRQYLDHRTIHTDLVPDALEAVIAYMNHYIFASCWTKTPKLLNLRLRADALATVEDIDAFIKACLEIGVDPL
jgi:hypothetical protein